MKRRNWGPSRGGEGGPKCEGKKELKSHAYAGGGYNFLLEPEVSLLEIVVLILARGLRSMALALEHLWLSLN